MTSVHAIMIQNENLCDETPRKRKTRSKVTDVLPPPNLTMNQEPVGQIKLANQEVFGEIKQLRRQITDSQIEIQ